MRNRLQVVGLIGIVSLALCLSACEKDEAGPELTGNQKVYALHSVSDASISGEVTFAERSDGVTVITIELTGASGGTRHPAHIHANTAAEGGSIVLDLEDVDASTGKSETVVVALNDGTPLSYEDITGFDGYVNVHLSEADLGTLIAQGDIGQNALTGASKQYTLGPVSNPNISGTATFEERVNGETLVTVQLTGTEAGGDHPSHIHNNSAAQGGGIAIDLANVNGETGIGKKNITAMNDGTPVTYEDLIDFDGYVNVHLSAASLGTLIAQGDVGQNALTGNSKVYDLNEVGGSGISGTVTFAERENSETLVTIQLTGTTGGNSHPSHIHNNSAAEGGGIAIDLANVNGETGIGRKNVSALNNGTPITYDGLLTFDGYVNVHLSADNLATLIAQGDIGANAN